MYQEKDTISNENVKINMKDRRHGAFCKSGEIQFGYSIGYSQRILEREREIMLRDLVETLDEAS